MVIMYLLADLEPVFNKHYPRKLDVNKGLTIEQQPNKMVKHTQRFRRLLQNNSFEGV